MPEPEHTHWYTLCMANLFFIVGSALVRGNICCCYLAQQHKITIMSLVISFTDTRIKAKHNISAHIETFWRTLHFEVKDMQQPLNILACKTYSVISSFFCFPAFLQTDGSSLVEQARAYLFLSNLQATPTQWEMEIRASWKELKATPESSKKGGLIPI